VVFQLAQLSYCGLAVRLAGSVEPVGEPQYDRYVFEVARVLAMFPERIDDVLPLLARIVTATRDGSLSLAACFQGLSYAIRRGRTGAHAAWFEEQGRHVPGLVDGWTTSLTRSRFHRGVALLRLVEGRIDAMHRELDIAFRCNEEVDRTVTDPADRLAVAENTRYLLELQVQAALEGHASSDELRTWCRELIRLDPFCVEARLLAGDGHAALGDYSEAARCYSSAGELGTGAGALGWYRAAQCFDALGDSRSAANAMARCLELDYAAVEPKAYLARALVAEPCIARDTEGRRPRRS
jgi:tetratricopeptide (TPR) repeat protein